MTLRADTLRISEQRAGGLSALCGDDARRRSEPLYARLMLGGLALLLLGCTARGLVLEGGEVLDAPSSFSAGHRHACAVLKSQVVCWGKNDQGQLGFPPGADVQEPTAIVANLQATQVAVGGAHSCARTVSGQVRCWGANQHGELGDGTREAHPEPSLVALPLPATRVVTKFEHSCALLVDQSLYCWGSNFEGQLGQDDVAIVDDDGSRDALTAARVPGRYLHVGTGQGHTCAISADNTLWCWGRNTDRQVSPQTNIQFRTPVQVGTEAAWLEVDAGQVHNCALRVDRSLWCWGTNSGSTSELGAPLGLAGLPDVAPSPTRVELGFAVASFSTNSFHSAALDSAGKLWVFGRNIEGQLGCEEPVFFPEPRLASECAASGSIPPVITAVSTGRFMTCVLSEPVLGNLGGLACTGANENGQLGLGNSERPHAFTALAGP